MQFSFTGLATASESTNLPNGVYRFKVNAIDPEYRSKDKDSPALEVKLSVIEGMDYEDGTSTRGAKRTLRLWYPHGGQKDGGKMCLGRLNAFLKACGVDTSSNSYDSNDILNKEFRCKYIVKVDENGRENEEFSQFKPV